MSTDIRVAPLEAPAPAFRSGRAELDEWLARHATGATRAGSARVYLAQDGAGVVGYFALAAGAVDPAQTGTRTRRGMPRHPIPVVLLARLAVSEHAQGRGVDIADWPSVTRTARRWRTTSRAPDERRFGWAAEATVHATITDMKEEPMKVTLIEPGLAGAYVVAEQREDGTLVLRPETSDEVIEQFANRTLNEEGVLESFDRLDAAAERDERTLRAADER